MPPFTRHDWADADVPPGVRSWMYDIETGIISAGLSSGNRVYVIGDSISSAGNGGFNLISTPCSFASTSYIAWASMLSGGRLLIAGVGAGPGITSAQVRATWLPGAIAAAPDACVVLAGTNDVVTINAGAASVFTAWQTTMISMYQQLLAAGIRPIVCTLPPRTGDTASLKKTANQMSAWLALYARTNHLPLIDFYSVLVNTTNGDFAAGLSADAIHQSGKGAKKMGQLMSDVLCGTNWLGLNSSELGPSVQPWKPYLAQSNDNTLVATQAANALFLTDSNADGLADGLSLAIGSAPTYSLATNAAVLGNYQGLARGAADVYVRSVSQAVNDGDVLYFAARLSATVEAFAGAKVGLRMTATNGSQTYWGFDSWDVDIPDGAVLVGTQVVPAGLGANKNVQLEFNAITTSGALIKVAQPTIVNLTALGLASA